MKFNPQSYQKELLVKRLQNHSSVGKDVTMRNIRTDRSGIVFDCYNGKEWKQIKLKQDTIDRIFAELRSV